MFEKLVMDIVGATCSVMRLIKTNVHHLKDGHDTLTSEQDISNKLGQIFSQNSTTQNDAPEFQKF
jgi:hypothetical protein